MALRLVVRNWRSKDYLLSALAAHLKSQGARAGEFSGDGTVLVRVEDNSQLREIKLAILSILGFDTVIREV